MKSTISTIVSAITLFALASLFYMTIGRSAIFASYLPLYRPEFDMKFWAIICGHLLQGFFFTLIYTYYYKGENPLKEGFIFGLLLGLLFALPVTFFMWATFPVSYKAAIVDGVGMGIRILVAGIVIGLIMGKKVKTE